MSYQTKLESILHEVIAPAAPATDSTGTFPRQNIDALGEVGLLGLLSSKQVGGMGLGLAEAADVVERISKACPSTAMIVSMHYCGTAIIEKFGPESVRRDIALGKHLTTLAWSDVGSRGHFWAPMGTAKADAQAFVLDCQKSMVTSAGQADSYVWSSKTVALEGASTLWLVDKKAPGLEFPKSFDGMGLRGNSSAPMASKDLHLPASAMLGLDGGGFDIMIGTVLPLFSTLMASASLGIMEAAMERSCAHVSSAKLEHLDSALSQLPTIRAYLARGRIQTDMTRTLRDDTVKALSEARPDAMLRVMQAKAGSAEAALAVTDIAMRVCGGAAFRKDVGVERYFRDARASSIMAPSSDVLFDFIGKAILGLPVFG